ncbi:S-layer protein (TIGR01567 family) [Methanohalophilus levihalophilus]|uniref:S-layer protein domain-containing protein n=1 Tax=Methanohalophilus levihalophilus TaxID=1431282 RepID=UPI001AE47E57|nr:S-layer protein domain-containing protein [Methanohalophilus levihalophilus]MBP2029879.1 S-layer protein (TIGR01567 family) [Methanohalophilus levihalophilus]
MKKLLTFAVAALMVLASVGAVSATDSVEIRGEVVEITAGTMTWDATNFAGFWLDLDTGDASENLTVIFDTDGAIDGNNLTYNATMITGQTTEFGFTANTTTTADYEFAKIGFMAEEYFVVDDDVAQLSKILMDDDESYTLRTGETLELGEGYAITPQQIDVDGNKVWLELTKDGDFLDDKIISTADATQANKTWFYEQDILDSEDIVTLMVHVDEVFQGQVDSLCVVEGIFQISDDGLIIETDDEYGELVVDSLTGGVIEMSTDEDNDLDVPDDDTLEIMDGIFFKGSEGPDRFYLMQLITEPGTHEIRGEVVEITAGTMTWDATSFAGFWLDLDTGDASENLTAIFDTDGAIDGNNLTYNATMITGQTTEFGFTANTTTTADYEFAKIGFMAEEYFVVDDDVAQLSKILMDDDESYTLRTGETLELGEGYAITPQQIDVDGNKVWLELTKDGDFLDDKIISTADATQANKTWFYEQDILDSEDIVTLMVHVDEVFQGQVDSLCVVEGIFQISDDGLIIETDDEYGELVVDSLTGGVIEMSTDEDNDIDVPDDDTLEIMDGIFFKGSEGPDRFYLMQEVTIEGDEADEEDDEEDMPEEDMPEEDMPEDNVTEDMPEEDMPEEDMPEEEEPVDEPDADTPGFEAVLAIGGLLAVAYLVRRN